MWKIPLWDPGKPLPLWVDGIDFDEPMVWFNRCQLHLFICSTFYYRNNQNPLEAFVSEDSYSVPFSYMQWSFLKIAAWSPNLGYEWWNDVGFKRRWLKFGAMRVMGRFWTKISQILFPFYLERMFFKSSCAMKTVCTAKKNLRNIVRRILKSCGTLSRLVRLHRWHVWNESSNLQFSCAFQRKIS